MTGPDKSTRSAERVEPGSTSGESTGVVVGTPLYFELVQFLYDEAALLDQDRYREWLELLADDLEYKMPVRASVDRQAGSGFVGDMGHFDDDLGSLTLRVRRLETYVAWAEEPPSRVRRFVTNVRAATTAVENRFAVSSYLLVLRSRGDSPDFEFISAERRDEIDRAPDGLQLRRRTILVDQSNLGTINMAIFL